MEWKKNPPYKTSTIIFENGSILKPYGLGTPIYPMYIERI